MTWCIRSVVFLVIVDNIIRLQTLLNPRTWRENSEWVLQHWKWRTASFSNSFFKEHIQNLTGLYLWGFSPPPFCSMTLCNFQKWRESWKFETQVSKDPYELISVQSRWFQSVWFFSAIWEWDDLVNYLFLDGLETTRQIPMAHGFRTEIHHGWIPSGSSNFLRWAPKSYRRGFRWIWW